MLLIIRVLILQYVGIKIALVQLLKYSTIFFRSNMERQPEDNPFLALFEPLQVQAPISPHRPKQSTPPISRDLSNEESTKILQRVNTLIEDIFAITINPYGFLGRHSNDPGTLFDYLSNTCNAKNIESSDPDFCFVLFDFLVLTRLISKFF